MKIIKFETYMDTFEKGRTSSLYNGLSIVKCFYRNTYSYTYQNNLWTTRQYPVEEGPYIWTLEYGQLNLRNERGRVVHSFGRNVSHTNAPTSFELEITDKELCLAKIYDKSRQELWASSNLPTSCPFFCLHRYLFTK